MILSLGSTSNTLDTLSHAEEREGGRRERVNDETVKGISKPGTLLETGMLCQVIFAPVEDYS